MSMGARKSLHTISNSQNKGISLNIQSITTPLIFRRYISLLSVHADFFSIKLEIENFAPRESDYRTQKQRKKNHVVTMLHNFTSAKYKNFNIRCRLNLAIPTVTQTAKQPPNLLPPKTPPNQEALPRRPLRQ